MILIHISDLHIRKDAKNNRRVATRLKAIEAWTKRTKKQWRIAATGDLTDDGTEAQYAQLRKLLAPFKGKILMVSGQHDFGVCGNFYDEECVSRFRKFDVEFSVEKTQPEFFTRLIDSNLHTDNVLDFAQGRVKDSTMGVLNSLPRSLSRPEMPSVVMLHHTPFEKDWFLRLQNAKDFLNATMGRVDLVLCGHSHKFFTYAYPGNGRPTRTLYVQAPALCNSDGQPVFIDTQNLKWICGSKKG